ncbi:Two-component sensor protein RcsC [Salmonella enterica]|nr:Two-component sensor protein RcsC [Salmonella enterica]
MGYFYALTPVYLANRLQALLGVEQSIRMEIFSRRQFADGRHYY